MGNTEVPRKAYLLKNHFSKTCGNQIEGQRGEKTAIEIKGRNTNLEAFVRVQGTKGGTLNKGSNSEVGEKEGTGLENIQVAKSMGLLIVYIGMWMRM